uniref:Uncharacterized protein LOC111108914 n=1 Tax=Crassostrea virginica TaxID=6565 RepID=A0A8B8BBA7_CRAVI|nr:uncharacterized protein LOC111108914 [Crassostrea virginica]
MSVTVRQFLCLSGIFYLACIGNATDVKPGADDTIYSGTGICSKSGHTTLDEKWREIGNGGTGNCDQGLPVGWYKFIINGKPATLPTLCIKNEACGTVVPLRVDLHDQPLPPVNSSLRVSVCGSYPILNKWDCCVLRRPAILHNCGSFLVYHLSPPDRCHVGYCVINEDNMMKLHAFTAKTGEASRGAAHPTFIPETTTSTTPSTTKATTKVTATGIGCPANQRRCPDGCVPCLKVVHDVGLETTKELKQPVRDRIRIPKQTQISRKWEFYAGVQYPGSWDHGNSTGFDYVDNQNEQPAMDESYCGVVLAFEFQASYLQNRLQVVFATLLNIYYVENHGIYIEGLFSWRMRYNREASKTYTSSHVHFGRGVHNDTLYFITLFAEDIFNEVLYLPDTVLNTLLQNATVAAFIQEEIQDFHATFLNLTRKVVNVTPRVSPSPAPPLMNIKLTLCVVFIAILLVCVTCALVAVRKNKNKNRCMKLRRKSGQYYVKWEKALKRDVCKGIGYIETPAKDCLKGDYSVNQNLIGSPERGCTEEEENTANDQRRKQFTVHKAWTFPLPESNGLVFIPGLQTKL